MAAVTVFGDTNSREAKADKSWRMHVYAVLSHPVDLGTLLRFGRVETFAFRRADLSSSPPLCDDVARGPVIDFTVDSYWLKA